MTDIEEIAILKDQIEELDKQNGELKFQNADLGYYVKTLKEDNEKLKKELKNYANVINQLMGTQLTDTEEVGRLIEIAQYGKWGELWLDIKQQIKTEIAEAFTLK